jgi:hypothetical protein
MNFNDDSPSRGYNTLDRLHYEKLWRCGLDLVGSVFVLRIVSDFKGGFWRRAISGVERQMLSVVKSNDVGHIF